MDVFIVATTLEEAKKKLENLFNSVTKKYKQLGREYCVVRTPNSVTICTGYLYKARKKMKENERKIER